MGIVFSCLASTFMLLGELTSTIFLAAGEVLSLVSRGLFGLIVGLCDVLAACMCCCQVPFSERPDRDGYTYTTMAVKNAPLVDKTRFSNASFANLPKSTSTKSFVKKSGAAKQEEVIGETASQIDEDVKESMEEEAAVQAPDVEKTCRDKPEVEGAIDAPVVAEKAEDVKTDKPVVKTSFRAKMANLKRKSSLKNKTPAPEIKDEVVEEVPAAIEEEKTEPVPVVEEAAPGWFSGWFSAAPTPATAPAASTAAAEEAKSA